MPPQHAYKAHQAHSPTPPNSLTTTPKDKPTSKTMCKIQGIRIHCACKDPRCVPRRDFTHRDAQGHTVRHAGHGWHFMDVAGSKVCAAGLWTIVHGQGAASESGARDVERAAGCHHSPVVVVWRNQRASGEGSGMICDGCREGGHDVTGDAEGLIKGNVKDLGRC